MTPEQATYALWGVWMVVWVIAAFWRDRASARPPSGTEWLYTAITVVGFVLLFNGYGARMLTSGPFWSRLERMGVSRHLWTLDAWAGWAFFALALAGFLFAIWARVALGRLWSVDVTRKADHRVVDTGPYRLVRHPIYTGLIAAAVALAAVRGASLGLAGMALLTLGFWIKARLEERFLREQLGAADYDAYAARTPMLIPFWPK